MLGEGYDNSLIAISVCIQPPGSVGVLSQFHGRALRLLKDAKYLNLPQAKVSHLFYPKWDRVQKVVEDYKLGKDESTENLFDDRCVFFLSFFVHMVYMLFYLVLLIKLLFTFQWV